MDGILIGISTVLVTVFVFTLSLSWVVAQLASSYSTKIIGLYFGRKTKLYLTLLLLNIAYPWIVMLWFSETFKKPCSVFSSVSAFFCLVMMMIYVFDMKKNVRPETLVKLTLDEARQEFKSLKKDDKQTDEPAPYLYQLNQLEIVEEILYKAIENVNNGLIEYGFWHYLKYTKEIFSLDSTSAYKLREHTINFLTSALLLTEFTHKSLWFGIIHTVIGKIIKETKNEENKYHDFLFELTNGIWIRIEAESFVTALPGTGKMKKDFIASCVVCILFIKAGWHEKDIYREMAFKLILNDLMSSKSKGDDYFEKNFQHAKAVIKQYRPELHKHLEPLKKMLEKKANENLRKEVKHS